MSKDYVRKKAWGWLAGKMKNDFKKILRLGRAKKPNPKKRERGETSATSSTPSSLKAHQKSLLFRAHQKAPELSKEGWR